MWESPKCGRSRVLSFRELFQRGNERKPPRTLGPSEQGAEPGRCLAWLTAAQGPLVRPPGIGAA